MEIPTVLQRYLIDQIILKHCRSLLTTSLKAYAIQLIFWKSKSLEWIPFQILCLAAQISSHLWQDIWAYLDKWNGKIKVNRNMFGSLNVLTGATDSLTKFLYCSLVDFVDKDWHRDPKSALGMRLVIAASLLQDLFFQPCGIDWVFFMHSYMKEYLNYSNAAAFKAVPRGLPWIPAIFDLVKMASK